MIDRYAALRRKIVLIMAAAATIPLLIFAAINYFEFQETFTREAQAPFRSMVSKTKNSFELFLAERSATVSLIASIYPYEDLADPKTLQRVFLVMQREFTGFVDLGLINDKGILVNYAGPHKELMGADYSTQSWFHKVRSKNHFVSDVFQGFRHFPHLIIAVQYTTLEGNSWIVRATIDTSQFTRLIAAMNLTPGTDAFLVNHEGVLQTDSAVYGKTFDVLPFPMPSPTYDATVVRLRDHLGKPIFLSYSMIADTDYILMAVMPTSTILQSWFTLRLDLVLLFFISVLVIYFVAARSVEQLVSRLRVSDANREQALLHMEHTQKLSSIGRLAAGVAHEINNPLAIVNEKAGLLQDLLQLEPGFTRREQFEKQLGAIGAAVARCRDITHRMLGFARRMDVKIEELNLNEIIRETLLFLEKEALHRNVRIILELAEDLPLAACDRGQMQQVFLNVLTNALAAVSDGGEVTVKTWERDADTVAVQFADNGAGMSEETKKHIFEPFYTTKKDQGTGLGMSIIYGIIKRHGGDIEVESELGSGSTVTIIIPVRQPQEKAVI